MRIHEIETSISKLPAEQVAESETFMNSFKELANVYRCFTERSNDKSGLPQFRLFSKQDLNKPKLWAFYRRLCLVGRRKLEVDNEVLKYRIDEEELAASFDNWSKKYWENQPESCALESDELHSLYSLAESEFEEAKGRAQAKDVWDELGK